MFALGACTHPDLEGATGAAPTPEAWRAEFSAERFKADLEFLADDALKGRDTGTEGYQIAANYVAAEFAKLGLTPKGTGTSYFQSVPFHSVVLDADTSHVQIAAGGRTLDLIAGEDFFMPSNPHIPSVTVEGAVVYAGHGIYAPEVGVDELTGLDLEGKLAAIFPGAPAHLNSEVRAHYGSTLGKAKALLERGATGIILLPDARTLRIWNPDRYTRLMANPNLSWIAEEGSDVSVPGRLSVVIDKDAADHLFAGSRKSFDEVFADKQGGEITGFPLAATANIRRESIVQDPITSPNVIGVLEGSDPVLKDEYVVLSAHLDHVGTRAGTPDQDNIFNGAMDNATGVSTMLEVARNLVKEGNRPKRSILLAAVTAEEKGLLGAEYFAHYPTVPKDAMVANVNLDMPVLLYDFVDVIAFGAERSSLGPLTQQALDQAGIALTPDPLPEQGLFTRSDHYRFVQQGIPSVFLMTGFADTPDGQNGGEIFRKFLSRTYHTPADQPSQPIRYDAGAKFAYVNYLILTAVANAPERPRWNEGDFFGALFAK